MSWVVPSGEKTNRAKGSIGRGIRAVCFDLDGTLYNDASLRIRMLGLLAQAFLRGRIGARELRILRSYRNNRERARALGSLPSIDEHTLAATAQECKCSIGEISATVERWLFQVPLPVLAGLRDARLRQTMRRLRLRGYRLGIFSDYPAKQKLEVLGLPAEWFDAIVEAGTHGVDALKPHPKGFLEVCRKLALAPPEVLYVGNRDSVDGAGARAVGMPFVLYRPFALFANSRAIRDLSQLEELLGSGAIQNGTEPPQGCWLCGSSRAREFLPSRIPADLSPEMTKITDASYGVTARLLRCEDCGFIRAEAPSAQAIEKLYGEMVDCEYEASAGARRKAFAHLLERIRELRPHARTLLDIGASTGHFCAEAARFGFEAEGVEPSAWAVAEGRRRLGVLLHEGYFPHSALEGRQFDVVTLLDVIEHVSQPLALLRAARQCLSPRGLLLVVTPDIGSFVARAMGARWWHLRPAHIGYFSRQTMTAALGAAGFQLEAKEPYTWWFPLSYLVERLEAYLPIKQLNQRLLASRWLGRAFRAHVPVRLGDSQVYFARPNGGNAS